MKWVYIAAGIALLVKMLIIPNPEAEWEGFSIVESGPQQNLQVICSADSCVCPHTSSNFTTCLASFNSC